MWVSAPVTMTAGTSFQLTPPNNVSGPIESVMLANASGLLLTVVPPGGGQDYLLPVTGRLFPVLASGPVFNIQPAAIAGVAPIGPAQLQATWYGPGESPPYSGMVPLGITAALPTSIATTDLISPTPAPAGSGAPDQTATQLLGTWTTTPPSYAPAHTGNVDAPAYLPIGRIHAVHNSKKVTVTNASTSLLHSLTDYSRADPLGYRLDSPSSATADVWVNAAGAGAAAVVGQGLKLPAGGWLFDELSEIGFNGTLSIALLTAISEGANVAVSVSWWI